MGCLTGVISSSFLTPKKETLCFEKNAQMRTRNGVTKNQLDCAHDMSSLEFEDELMSLRSREVDAPAPVNITIFDGII